jgi:hypothetical protein
MRTFAVIALAGFAAAYTPMDEMDYKFINYVAEHGKSYGTKEEYNFRKSIFAAKDAEMNQINDEQGSYTLGHNKFSDWTDSEYKRILGYKKIAGIVDRAPEPTDNATVPPFTTGVNWVNNGAVTPVKDQG